MGLKSLARRALNRVSDGIARASALSPAQLKELEVKRERYLSESPNPNDPTSEALTEHLLAACGVEIYDAYLPRLKDLYLPVDPDVEHGSPFNGNHNIRYVQLTRWVVDENESTLEKLANVYEVLASEQCNIALVFNRTLDGTQVYLAVVDNENSEDNVNVNNYLRRISEALRGNFPGSE